MQSPDKGETKVRIFRWDNSTKLAAMPTYGLNLKNLLRTTIGPIALKLRI